MKRNVTRIVVVVAVLAVLVGWASLRNSPTIDDSECPVEIIHVKGQPVRVLDCSVAKTKDGAELHLTIVNDTKQSLRFVGFLMGGTECEEDKPRFLVTHGADSALNPNCKWDDPPLPPGGIATVVAWGLEIVVLLQQGPKCPSDKKPFVVLRKVAFCDGTGWESLESESAPHDWSGREWDDPNLLVCE